MIVFDLKKTVNLYKNAIMLQSNVSRGYHLSVMILNSVVGMYIKSNN